MKTELTRKIERKLATKFLATSDRFAFEVPVSKNKKDYGIVDCVTVTLKLPERPIPLITCYEIKVSTLDFKSKNGHNLFGDYNYYVTTKEVWEWLQKQEFNYSYGVIIYDNDKMYIKKESVLNLDRFYIEQRFKLLDDILIKWESGTMYRMLKSYDIDLRNG